MSSVRPLLRSSWTWLIAGLLLVGLVSLIAAGNKAPAALDAGSARPNGALALRLWLQRIGYEVSVTGTRPNLAGIGSSGTVLLLADGADAAGRDLSDLISWVRSGGRLVLGADGNAGGSVLDRLGVSEFGLSGTGEAIRVVQPLLLAPPVASLHGTASVVVQGQARDVEVASVADGSVLLTRHMGRGQVWVLSAPGLLDNAHIASGDNRRLALNLAGPPGAHILFDQFSSPAGGQPDGNWLTSTAWGVALLFLIAVLVLYRWLSGWRLGPTVTPLRLQYRPASEYVVSLAGLLRRGRRREDVLAIYQGTLRRLVRRRYGDLESAAINRQTQDELESLLRPVARLSDVELVRRAAAIVAEEAEMRGER